MRTYRVALIAAAAVAAAGGAVALVSAALGADESCATFPDANDPSVTHTLCGPVLERYRAEGGAEAMGLPVSGERPVTFAPALKVADREVEFARGMIYLNSRTGEASTGGWYPYVPITGR